MIRFYGNAVFEGEEVSDTDYASLVVIRQKESSAIDSHKFEFKLQIDILTDEWIPDEIAEAEAKTSGRIAEQEELIAQCHANINTIYIEHDEAIAEIYRLAQIGMPTEIAEAEAKTSGRIAEQEELIAQCHANINTIYIEHDEAIAEIYRLAQIEYDFRLNLMEHSIALSHRVATGDITSIYNGIEIAAVHEVRGEKTACEICKAKIGTIGTMAMLAARDCVPPFHENCKCWLEEIGYCVL